MFGFALKPQNVVKVLNNLYHNYGLKFNIKIAGEVVERERIINSRQSLFVFNQDFFTECTPRTHYETGFTSAKNGFIINV